MINKVIRKRIINYENNGISQETITEENSMSYYWHNTSTYYCSTSTDKF